MDKDVKFISIREIVSRLLRHSLLLSLDLEAATLYTKDFIDIAGTPDMYETKEAEIHIDNFRAKLPCDLVSVILVMDKKSHLCLRSMSDSFAPKKHHIHHCGCNEGNGKCEDLTFKTLNSVIFTSFKDGDIIVSYRAIHTDEEGYPMVIDNTNFLKALELYIKLEIFTELFDLGKINERVLNNTQLEYCWYVGKCIAEFLSPSLSEMESISRDWNTLIPRMTQFDNGFRNLGNREYLRNH